jgi:hypothetical protein
MLLRHTNILFTLQAKSKWRGEKKGNRQKKNEVGKLREEKKFRRYVPKV